MRNPRRRKLRRRLLSHRKLRFERWLTLESLERRDLLTSPEIRFKALSDANEFGPVAGAFEFNRVDGSTESVLHIALAGAAVGPPTQGGPAPTGPQDYDIFPALPVLGPYFELTFPVGVTTVTLTIIPRADYLFPEGQPLTPGSSIYVETVSVSIHAVDFVPYVLLNQAQSNIAVLNIRESAASRQLCGCQCACSCSGTATAVEPASGRALVSLPGHLRLSTAELAPPKIATSGLVSQNAVGAIQVTTTVDGLAGTTAWYDASTASLGGEILFDLPAGAPAASPGKHDWKVQVTEQLANGTQREKGWAGVLHQRDDDLGFGRGVRPNRFNRLSVTPGLITAETSCGDNLSFRRLFGGGWLSPLGDPRQRSLTELADGFRIADKFGELEFFDLNGLPLYEEDPFGNRTTYSYLDADGDSAVDELATIVGPFGDTTTFAYTPGGQLASVTAHDGRTFSYGFDAGGQLVSVTEPDPDGTGPLAAPVTTFAWQAGFPVSLTDPAGHTQSFAYNGAGHVVAWTAADGATTAYQPQDSFAFVDIAAGEGTQQNPAPLVRLADVTGSQTDALGRTQSFQLDAFAHPRAVTDEYGVTTTYVRDVQGRAVSETIPDPDGAGPAGDFITTFQYDSRSNVAQMQLPTGTRTWQYDATWNVPVAYTDERGSQTLFALDPAHGSVLSQREVVGQVDSPTNGETDDVVTAFAYTSAGQLDTVTDPLGRVTDYDYDAHGEVTRVTAAAGTAAAAFVEFDYDAAGRLVESRDELSRVTTYGYDHLHRLIRTTRPDPDGAGPLAAPEERYEYDALGRRTKEIDPLNQVTEYVYDDDQKERQTPTLSRNSGRCLRWHDAAPGTTPLRLSPD